MNIPTVAIREPVSKLNQEQAALQNACSSESLEMTGGCTEPIQGTPLEHLVLVTREICAIGHLQEPFYKAITSKQRDITDLPNT